MRSFSALLVKIHPALTIRRWYNEMVYGKSACNSKSVKRFEFEINDKATTIADKLNDSGYRDNNKLCIY